MAIILADTYVPCGTHSVANPVEAWNYSTAIVEPSPANSDGSRTAQISCPILLKYYPFINFLVLQMAAVQEKFVIETS
jgi:hypothetical protein